ncbi:MAG: Unknown protein [uncultured Sulfurovum sp.]|uniref:Uncharacterized protein n=1 Tax=uncultured Sulfurovum sp. TaxID=269237 RepID=A0A6S6TA85_9BACT|nr:MAG: Unknown protein [uncultured Sulfurovum sp.]
MSIQTIRLDISSDILDKVMFILENLPKNKIKFSFENSEQKVKPKEDTLVNFFKNSPLVDSISLKREQEVYQNRIEF